MRTLIIAGLLALSAAPVLAAATPWQDVAPGARLRLISSDARAADGTTTVGLELDMPDTSKTYWRLPGETGIPTELDIAGSSGVSDAAIEWPYPTPEQADGFLDYVYRGATVLPVTVKVAGDAALLQASVVMGVCSDVCVPVRASFSLPLSFAATDPGQSIRLRRAEALAPIGWSKADAPFGPVTLDRMGGGLRIDLADAGVDPASVIASTDDPTVLFDPPQKSPDGHSILLKLRGVPKSADWQGKPVLLTFMTAMGSFEIPEPLVVSP